VKPDDLDALMRAGESYHNVRVPLGCYIVVRVDGRSFTRLTNEEYERPFDLAFHQAMVGTARTLLTDLGGIFTCAHSDEISVLLPHTWDNFDREVEKTVSIAAGTASARFTLSTQRFGAFDGRLWIGATDEQVVDYFRWRQADSLRGALNSMPYWALRRDGKNERQATAALHKQGVAFKNDLLFNYGINFNEMPVWQRRGTVLYWELYEKVGHNPITKEDVIAVRRRVRTDDEPPAGEAYGSLIRSLLAAPKVAEKEG